jgi:ubiquinone/menaquinone biosynthesis C-methylase UbiE
MKKVHCAAFDILKGYETKGLLLDAAGGDGSFASEINKTGYRAVVCDFYLPSQIKAAFIQADLNLPLPFKTGVFQVVTCMESLQYLENHKLLFREFARILKKDGRLLVTVPNMLNCGSRLFFTKAGYFKYFTPFKTVKPGREWDKIVYSPVSFVEIFQLMESSGVKVETLSASGYRNKEWLLFLLYKIFYKISSVFKKDAGKKRLLDFLYSREILLGDHIIVTARKTA